MSAFLAVLARELRLSLRHGADTLAALLFFLLAASLFPLAIGPAPETLGRIAPGIVWVCALLASLLPLERLFGADFDDGSLDQLLLCGLPPAAIALAKALAHWLVTGLPLLIAAAPLAVMLRMPDAALPALLGGLLPGTLLLSLLGAAGAAIGTGRPSRRGVAAAPGVAADQPGRDLRRRCRRRRGGWPQPSPASAAARRLACRRPAALPARRRGRTANGLSESPR